MATGYSGFSGYGGVTPPPVTCETLFDNVAGNVTLTDGNTGALFGAASGLDIANTTDNFVATASEQGMFFSFDISSLTAGDAIAFGFADALMSVFAFANFEYDGADFSLTITTSAGAGGPITLLSPLDSDEFCVTASTSGNTINVYRNQSLELGLPTLNDFSQLDHGFVFLTNQNGLNEQIYLIQNPVAITGVTQYCTNE